MRIHSAAAMCSMVAACVCACPSYAADRSLEEVFVFGEREGSLTVPGVDAAERELARIPGGVALVSAEAFEQRYALNVKDMLALTPGVFAEQRWAEEVRLSIRGSGIARSFHLRGIELLQDGVPINQADGSGDFQEVDPLVQRYVEVYKGGNGLRYGASSLGGAINFVTPTGFTARAPRALRLEAGSFDTYRAHASAAGVGDAWDYYSAVTWVSAEGWREQSRQASARFSGNVGYRFGDRAETRFYLSYNHIDQEVPGTLSFEDALERPRSAPAVNVLNDYARDVRSLRISNKTAWRVAGARVEAGAYLNDKDIYHPIFQVVDQESLDYGAFARVQFASDLWGVHHAWTLGANVKANAMDALRFVNVGGERGALTAEARQRARNVEVYAEDRIELAPRWQLTLGLQALRAVRDHEDRLAPAASDERSFEGVNPSIGVMWRWHEDAQLFANLTRSYEVPTWSELNQAPFVGFVPLDAQRAWTFEVGTRGTLGAVRWDVTAYRARVDGELLQYTVDADFPAATFNAPRTVHQGLEAGVEVGFPLAAAWHLELRGAYTLNDFSFSDDPQYGDNALPGIPLHALRAELRLAHTTGWHVAPLIEWVPRGAYVDYRNTLRTPSYATLGLSAGYDLSENVSLYLDARNLTDKRYISNFSAVLDAQADPGTVFYPGEPRAVFCGVRLNF